MTVVRGRVVDAAGHPVAGVLVELRAQRWRGSVWRATSDGCGIATFVGPQFSKADLQRFTAVAPELHASPQTTFATKGNGTFMLNVGHRSRTTPSKSRIPDAALGAQMTTVLELARQAGVSDELTQLFQRAAAAADPMLVSLAVDQFRNLMAPKEISTREGAR